MEYRVATVEDLEKIWDKNILRHPTDTRWVCWRKEYIDYNKNNEATTFVVVNDTDPIGEITILYSPKCKPIDGREWLADGNMVANMNAFRIEKEHEGQGHISNLVKVAERYAKDKGIEYLTIGVEASEVRNISIYFHFGYTEYIGYEIDSDENDALVLYYRKKI